MKDHEVVNWMIGRMVEVYGESPNVDFLHRARAVAANIESQAATIARYETTAENCDMLRDKVEAQAQEIERLGKCKRFESQYHEAERELAALKAQPSGVALPDLRTVVTDAFMGMIAAVTSTTPPADQPPPPFIQSAIDRAVDRIARLNQPASAALSANHSEQVRVVPVEPTEAMRKAAQDKLASEGLIVTDWLIHTAYAAMLAAAPTQPAAE